MLPACHGVQAVTGQYTPVLAKVCLYGVLVQISGPFFSYKCINTPCCCASFFETNAVTLRANNFERQANTPTYLYTTYISPTRARRMYVD